MNKKRMEFSFNIIWFSDLIYCLDYLSTLEGNSVQIYQITGLYVNAIHQFVYFSAWRKKMRVTSPSFFLSLSSFALFLGKLNINFHNWMMKYARLDVVLVTRHWEYEQKVSFLHDKTVIKRLHFWAWHKWATICDYWHLY